MKLSLSMVLSLLLSATGIPASAQPALTGEWIGGYETNGNYVAMMGRFKAESGALSGALDLPQLRETNVAVTQVRSAAPEVHFELPRGNGRLVFEGALSGEAIAGTIQYGNQRGTFHLVRTVTVDPKVLEHYLGEYQLGPDHYLTVRKTEDFEPFGGIRFSESDSSSPALRFGKLFPASETAFFAGPARWVPYPVEVNVTFVGDEQGRAKALKWKPKGGEEVLARRVTRQTCQEVEVKFTNGTVTLAATMTLPLTKGPHPAVVLISGSDGYTRMRGLPQFFAEHGIAALSYDKRGKGASTGDFETATLDDFVGDVSAGVRFLQSRPEIRSKQVGVWGISNGGWIAPCVATRAPDVAFLILHAGPAVTPMAQGRMELINTMPLRGFTPEEIKQASAYQDLYFEAMQSDAAYEKLRATYDKVRASGARWAWNPGPKEALKRQWTRNFNDFDPVPVLAKVRCPVLAFFGEKDVLVPPEGNVVPMKTALQKGSNEDVTIKVLPGANHRFEVAGTGARDFGTTGKSVSGYYDFMVEWIKKHTPATTDTPRPNR
ncbi:MAG TPA: alpha/beta hydrolase [Gemmataceae bacterium]|nr:alpha/beta hydrolase [Gemmataceae bacterium]